jgi:holin-like protein
VVLKLSRLAGQLILIWFIYWASNAFADFSGLPIPGNVIGVILLFGLLSARIVRLEHIAEGADFLLKHLVFFFIPLTVSLMNWGHIFYDYGIVLAAAIVISTILPFWTVGYLTQLFIKREKKCRS